MSLQADAGFQRVMLVLEGQGLPSLAMYKEKCLRRRLAIRMRAVGAEDYHAYADRLATEPGEAALLLQTLSIGVTGFFRNPEAWERLRAALPSVPRRIGQPLSGWSAGCASGEEAWTLAMLMADLTAAGGAGSEAVFQLDGTDLDQRALGTARDGWYPEDAFAEAPDGLVRRWTEPVGNTRGGGRKIHDGLRTRVRFRLHDLGADPPPAAPYDVIVCRNVLIYFERPTQEVLFERFADALHPGGLLLLGKVEALYGPARERFRTVDGRERLFRRHDG